MEQELGISLFIRKKGHRNIELTSYGEAFIPIASQWAALWKDTQNLKYAADIQTLQIAAVDAVSNCTFVPLFNRHIEQYPNIRLSVNTFHSEEIHDMIQNRTMDMGFVFKQIRYPDILSKPVYRELMYLVCHKDSNYHNHIQPGELNPEEEIFLCWENDYQQWHDRHWNPAVRALITVNTGSMLQHYLGKPGRWAIAPMSVIQSISPLNNLTWYSIDDGPPPRICYQLTNRYSKASRLAPIETFTNELEEFIEKSLSICRFEDWMLA